MTPKTNVLVTVELTELQEFKDYVCNLHGKGRLARIIVDEAHLVLTHAAFRKVMESLTWFGPAGPQIVLQTATLPPSLQERVVKAMGLSTCFVIRARTCRPNLACHVIRCSFESLDDVVKQYFQRALTHSDDGRVIVFCKSKAKAEQMGRLLDIPFTHSSLDQEKQEAVLDQLHKGTVRGVAATSVLGVAVDIPNVTHVIHVETPYDIISYVQEAGRAGRASPASPAWSFVILPEAQRKGQNRIDHDLFGAEALGEIWQDDTICRRLAIQVFLDGAAEPCSMMTGIVHLCDVCLSQRLSMPTREQASHFPWAKIQNQLASLRLALIQPPVQHQYRASVLPTASPITLQISSAHATRQIPPVPPPTQLFKKLYKAHVLMQRLAQTCSACWLLRSDCVYDHLLKDCPRAEAPNGQNAAWLQWRARLVDHAHNFTGVCYSCTCPQDVCFIIAINLALIVSSWHTRTEIHKRSVSINMAPRHPTARSGTSCYPLLFWWKTTEILLKNLWHLHSAEGRR